MDAFPAPAPFGSTPPLSPPTPSATPGGGRRIALGVAGGLAVLVAGGLAFLFLHKSEIQWTQSYDAGMTRARMENRPVLIDFSQPG